MLTVKISEEERDRYDRQLLIDEIGIAGQEKLKKGNVLICGAGGLGSPAAIYLVAAGIGSLTIVDDDRVTLSNLNRQILHGEADIGCRKVDSAKEKLARINSNVTLETKAVTMHAGNAAKLIAGHHVIIDALDNLETRHVLNQAALGLGIPLVHGAVSGFEGRAMTVIPGQSACLRCLHRRGESAPAGRFPVIGVTAAVIGAIQATEAIKLLLGVGDGLQGRMAVYDGLALKWKEFKLNKNPACDHCGQPLKRMSGETDD